jgi:hypothetical protein
MDPKLEPGAYVALTPGLDLTLVEQPEVLPVKLLRVGVLTALEAFVLIVVADSPHHHEIAADHR